MPIEVERWLPVVGYEGRYEAQCVRKHIGSFDTAAAAKAAYDAAAQEHFK